MFITLQGGYNLTSIAHSMVAICNVLLGDALPKLEEYVVANEKLVILVQH